MEYDLAGRNLVIYLPGRRCGSLRGQRKGAAADPHGGNGKTDPGLRDGSGRSETVERSGRNSGGPRLPDQAGEIRLEAEIQGLTGPDKQGWPGYSPGGNRAKKAKRQIHRKYIEN